MPTHTQSQNATRQGGKGRGQPAQEPENNAEAAHRARSEGDDENWGALQVKAPSEEPEGGEADGRHAGLEAGGGVPLNTPLEDGQLRGVDQDGQPVTGTHGGPKEKGLAAKGVPVKKSPTNDRSETSTATRGNAGGQGNTH